MRQLLTERYRERLAGVLSCYDRIIVTGTLPGACYADGMTAFLSARQVRIFDYPRFAEPLRCRSPRDFDQLQVWSDGPCEEPVIGRTTVDTNVARGAAGRA